MGGVLPRWPERTGKRGNSHRGRRGEGGPSVRRRIASISSMRKKFLRTATGPLSRNWLKGVRGGRRDANVPSRKCRR